MGEAIEAVDAGAAEDKGEEEGTEGAAADTAAAAGVVVAIVVEEGVVDEEDTVEGDGGGLEGEERRGRRSLCEISSASIRGWQKARRVRI